jgi:SAM-dependent methyltransferase
VDIGCGYNALTLQYIQTHCHPKKCIAVDLHLNTSQLEQLNIECKQMDLENTFPLDNKADIVIATAIFEHIHNITALINFIYITLKPKGILLATVPSIRAKPVLECMAYRLKIIDRTEIDDHKQYYNKKTLVSLLRNHKW